MTKTVIGILAHVDAGKTTLSESILYKSGAIRKLGRVDSKDAFLDNYALERERGITIFSKQAQFAVGEKEFILLDTPGHVDFSAEMERTLQVLDYAILVVSAADGVTGHTRTLWKLLKIYDIPTFVFVNKMDQQGADRAALMMALTKNLSSSCVEFEPEDNIWRGNNTECSGKQGMTEMTYEEIASCDEDAMEQFFEKQSVDDDIIRDIICERKLFPCFFGSALKQNGIDWLLMKLGTYTELPQYGDDFSARVYKISRDDSGNRLTHLKVTGGKLSVRDTIGDEKISQIRVYSGEKYVTAKEACAGDICAVLGLGSTKPGECLGDNGEKNMMLLEPVLEYSMVLPSDCPTAVMLPKLRQIEEEEPELSIVWNEETSEIAVRLMGEVQLEILKSVIKDRFGVDVTFANGTIVYKETIADIVEGVGHFEPLRHYAEVHLKLEPLETGSGLVFATDVSEDVLDKNWQRLILTHLEEKRHRGVLTGGLITDMKITVINGRAHKKHTEGGDFRQATYRAVRQGLMQAHSVLLEPYYSFSLQIPENVIGRAMTDLEKLDAKFKAPMQESGMAVITGMAPVRTLQGYLTEVIAYSKGNGSLTTSFCGYYPCKAQEKIVEEFNYDPTADLRNTPDSVFCAHGAGFVVPWDEVEQYMHIEKTIKAISGCCTGVHSDENQNEYSDAGDYMQSNHTDKKQAVPGTKIKGASNMEAERVAEKFFALDTEEIDSILDKTFFANSGSKNKKKWVSKRIVRKDPVFYAASQNGARKTSEEKREKYLLVDGYNIIFAWEELEALAKDNIDGARGKLMDILCNYQGIVKVNLIVVFDAYRVAGHDTEITDYHNIHVVYTKEAETADQYIEKFAHEHGRKYDIRVATSDGLEQIIIRGNGCALVSSREFEKEVQETINNTVKSYESAKASGKVYIGDHIDMSDILRNK